MFTFCFFPFRSIIRLHINSFACLWKMSIQQWICNVRVSNRDSKRARLSLQEEKNTFRHLQCYDNCYWQYSVLFIFPECHCMRARMIVRVLRLRMRVLNAWFNGKFCASTKRHTFDQLKLKGKRKTNANNKRIWHALERGRG